jgi:hypothetical protein
MNLTIESKLSDVVPAEFYEYEYHDHKETNTLYTENNITNRNPIKFNQLINGIVKLQNFSDNYIKLIIILFVLTMNTPYILLDYYFQRNANSISYVYLLVSISERQILSFIFYYYIITQKLHDIYKFPKGNKTLAIICKIDRYWYKYYSILGITIVLCFYFITGCVNSTNTYILLSSCSHLLYTYISSSSKKLLEP